VVEAQKQGLEGSQGDLPRPPACHGVGPSTGAARRGAASLGVETPEEGSSRQGSAAFLAGVVRKINHHIEPQSKKQAQKYVVREAADIALSGVRGSSWPQACPWDWCLCLPAQHPAPSTSSTQATRWGRLSVPARP